MTSTSQHIAQCVAAMHDALVRAGIPLHSAAPHKPSLSHGQRVDPSASATAMARAAASRHIHRLGIAPSVHSSMLRTVEEQLAETDVAVPARPRPTGDVFDRLSKSTRATRTTAAFGTGTTTEPPTPIRFIPAPVPKSHRITQQGAVHTRPAGDGHTTNSSATATTAARALARQYAAATRHHRAQ